MVRGFFVFTGFLLFSIIILPALVVMGLRAFGGRESSWGRPTSMYPIQVYNVPTGEIVTMDLEEYLVGVVAAEMPADFHIEALKAQAVAARTFAMKRMRLLGGRGCSAHSGADVCTDAAHCQAWLSKEELEQRWGITAFPGLWQKVWGAVQETKGLIITYRGLPIDAVFHSTSGGQTESALNAWGKEVPYLQSVRCQFDSHSPHFAETFTFSRSEFVGKVLADEARAVALAADENAKMEVTRRSASGRVLEFQIGGIAVSGQQVRERVGLPSTSFTVKVAGSSVEISTRGYGHGVGMSQYGADGMADAGYDFKSILKHFYTGVEISPGPYS